MDGFNRELGTLMRCLLDLVVNDGDAMSARVFVDMDDKCVTAYASAEFIDGSRSSQNITIDAKAADDAPQD